MNNIVVAKFGGSSLSDAGQFRRVKDIVQSDEKRRFIIPSAPGKRNGQDKKITDLLYACQKKADQGCSFDDEYNMIAQRYTEIVNELGLNLNISGCLNEVKEKIKNGASADYAASRGEYLNGIVLSSYLNMEFVDAAEIILFDDDGHFMAEKTQRAVSEKLSGMKGAVIPGFYGSMTGGDIKTFSRGGSDITGAIIARGVDADMYENWTDVSGFLMADPRIVENPKVMERVTYRELRELAYMGATVLHEDAIFPVRQAGIPINIKNTNRPEDRGTLIEDDLKHRERKGTITGIAGRKDFTVITIEKTLMNAEVGFGSTLLSILEEYNVPFEHMPSGIDTVSLVIEESELEGKLDGVLHDIREKCRPDSVQVSPDMALIATVGRGMSKTIGMAARVFTALAGAGVNIKMIDQGSSGINIIVGVENSDFERAVRAIYNAFV